MLYSQNFNSWHYRDIFKAIATAKDLPLYLQHIAQVIYEHGFNRERVEGILKKNGIDSIYYIKEDLIDLLLSYLYVILDDHYISEDEYRDFGLLKILFKIKEGDFYYKRYYQVREILQSHISLILTEDQTINKEEALLKVNLQDMFSLSYDQFTEFESHILTQPITRSVDFKPKFIIHVAKT